MIFIFIDSFLFFYSFFYKNINININNKFILLTFFSKGSIIVIQIVSKAKPWKCGDAKL